MKLNKLTSDSNSQHKKMDKHMLQCYCGDIPAGKLYIKLPIEEKNKDFKIAKIRHKPMRTSPTAAIARANSEEKTSVLR